MGLAQEGERSGRAIARWPSAQSAPRASASSFPHWSTVLAPVVRATPCSHRPTPQPPRDAASPPSAPRPPASDRAQSSCPSPAPSVNFRAPVATAAHRQPRAPHAKTPRRPRHPTTSQRRTSRPREPSTRSAAPSPIRPRADADDARRARRSPLTLRSLTDVPPNHCHEPIGDDLRALADGLGIDRTTRREVAPLHRLNRRDQIQNARRLGCRDEFALHLASVALTEGRHGHALVEQGGERFARHVLPALRALCLCFPPVYARRFRGHGSRFHGVFGSVGVCLQRDRFDPTYRVAACKRNRRVALALHGRSASVADRVRRWTYPHVSPPHRTLRVRRTS